MKCIYSFLYMNMYNMICTLYSIREEENVVFYGTSSFHTPNKTHNE